MNELLEILIELASDLSRLVVVLARLLIQYGLLAAWWAWWLFLVDWRQFWPALRRGAWMPLLLALGLVSYLAWLLAVPIPGAAELGALAPVLTCLALLVSVFFCGWLQTLFGRYPAEISFEAPAPHPTDEHDDHAHFDQRAHNSSGPHTVSLGGTHH